ncbi:MAG: Na+-transporting NADH:ubiquinone oxidoreductase subunit A [Oceanospirillaceae bacterium]|jgi:Na+-transporting NADH:ubiquinone oxidoreductase subunit A
MSMNIKISKGLNIPVDGQADKVYGTSSASDTVLVKPTDFKGLTPKLLLKEGAEVKAGTGLFFSKDHPDVKIVSPVSGEIAEIVRGAKRKILGVKILADKETRYEDFGPLAANASNDDVKAKMVEMGLISLIKRRPFGTVARTADAPKAIFVSGCDTAPLAADYDFIVHGQGAALQAGFDTLGKLTTGKVHFTTHESLSTAKEIKDVTGVEKHTISGPHPAGNVGVQINHIDPINKGDVAWTVSLQDVLVIGKAMLTGRFDASRIVAVVGPAASSPKFYRTVVGASMKSLVGDSTGANRVISGNILTGEKVGADGYLGYFHKEVTVVEEGDSPKFFVTDGWAGAGLNKHSVSRSYFSWMMPSKKYKLDTNNNGEERALVVTGQYENVFPMDVLPQHLLKAIIIQDIELMENLGIYEVDEEDFALCEYVCTSKTPVQEIVKNGLLMLEKEVG